MSQEYSNSDDDLKILREKTGQELLKNEFKKNLFGGVSHNEVLQYVNSLNEQAQHAERIFQERIKELTKSRDALKQECAMLSDKFANVKGSAESYEELIKKLQEENEDRQKQIQSMENKLINDLQIKDEAIKRLQEENEDRQKLIQSMDNKLMIDLQIKEEAIKALREENENRQKLIQSMESKLINDLQIKEEAIKALQEENENRQKLIQSMESKLINDLQIKEEAIKALQEENENRQKQMQRVENKLISDLQIKEEVIKTLQEENQAKKIQIQDMESRSGDLQIKDYEKKITSLKTMIPELQKLVKEKDMKIERDWQSITRLQKEKTDAESFAASLREDIASNYRQLEEQTKYNHKLVIQLEKERKRSEYIEKEKIELEEKLFSIQNSYHNYQGQSIELIAKMSTKSEDINKSMSERILLFVEELQKYNSVICNTGKELKDIVNNNAKAVMEICSVDNDKDDRYDSKDNIRENNIINLTQFKAVGS